MPVPPALQRTVDALPLSSQIDRDWNPEEPQGLPRSKADKTPARSPTDSTEPATRDAKPCSRLKTWGFRLAALGLGGLLLLLAETGLRLLGSGRDLHMVIPVEAATSEWTHQLNPLLDQVYFSSSVDVSGPEPRSFGRPKPAGTFRILVAGASTVIGFPYAPELAFPRQIEVQLESQSPDLVVEVLNAGMTAMNSFVVADVVAHAADCEADLIIVHTGHNEFYGPGGVASSALQVPPATVPWLYRLRRLRLFQMLAGWMGDDTASDQDLIETLPASLEIPLEGDTVAAAEEVFRRNVQRMARSANKLGIPLLLTSVAANLRDQSPIRHLPPEDLTSQQHQAWQEQWDAGLQAVQAADWTAAVAAWEQAETLYDGDALVAYRKAQSLEQLQRDAEALAAYRRARDLDACRFRAPSSFTEILRSIAVASDDDQVSFLDVEAAVDQASAPHAPGFNLFLEHVHYRFDGHCLVGEVIAKHVQQAVLDRPWDVENVPTRPELEQRLGFIPQDDVAAYSFAVQTLGTPPLSGAADVAEHTQRLRNMITDAYSALAPVDQQVFADLSLREMQLDLIGGLRRRYRAAGLDERALDMARLGVLRQPWSRGRRHTLNEELNRLGIPEDDSADGR